jgi:quinoprotein relay system zinc metallohydrolase 2
VRAAAGGLLAALITAAAAAAPLPVVEVAPGIFVHQGVHEDFTPANRGGIANLAFVVGTTGVAVVDSGGSPAQARDLLAAIRARTDLPLAYVINTHDHPDHVLGNAVLAAEGAVVVGHARLPAAMATRGPFYLANMRRLLGAAAGDAELVPPTVTVAQDAPLRLDLGARTLELRAWPVAHTGSDLTVLDRATGTLFAGDLLFMERLPVVDGSLTGWLEVLDELAALPASRVVPGHGPPVAPWPDALLPQRAYLEGLRDAVRASLHAGRSLPETVAEVPPPAASWLLRAGNHERNVTAAYTELEWE